MKCNINSLIRNATIWQAIWPITVSFIIVLYTQLHLCMHMAGLKYKRVRKLIVDIEREQAWLPVRAFKQAN